MDIIDKFLSYTENVPSPEIFRLWAAISMVAGALERRVWLETSAGKLYPNLFVMLVAPPAVGKGMAIDRVAEIWRAAKKLHIAPDSMTKASLMDTLAASGKRIPIKDGKGLYEYTSLSIAVEEFGVLVPAHDMEFLSVLIRLYSCPANYQEVRRTTTSVDIINPQLNMLVGTQPEFLAHLLPDEAWGMGFMSRMFMIYSTFGPDWDEFTFHKRPEGVRLELIANIADLASLMGQMEFSEEFINLYRLWKRDNFAPVPSHSRLRHYNSRRPILLLKLSMISAASRGSHLVEQLDLERARSWQIQAEVLMPDIFREMVGKSDIQLILDLHLIAWQFHSKEKKPLPDTMLYDYLSNKCPAERAKRIIELAVNSGYLEHLHGTNLYIPRAKTGFRGSD